MIIMLEGPDGSGKTTLANQIADACKTKGIDYVMGEPLIPTKPGPNRIGRIELVTTLAKWALDETTIYILDRGPISDCIYRIFDNYEPVISIDDLTTCLQNYQAHIALIYCYTEKAEELMKERGDDNPVALANHSKISYCYSMIIPLLQSAGLSLYRYNFANVKREMYRYEFISHIIDRLYSYDS